MPTRLVRDGINDSERVDALSLEAELFYRRLINVVDDYGRFEADPILIISRAFPRRATKITSEQVEYWLAECSAGFDPLIILYTVGRKRYLQVENFNQRIRTQSKYPDPFQQHASRMLSYDGQLTGKEPQGAAYVRATPSPSPPPSPIASASEALPTENTQKTVVTVTPMAQFERFWAMWSSVRGTNHRSQAMETWARHVTSDNAEEAIRCCMSYLASLDNPARGYNPENFLNDQAADDFRARWPNRSRDPSEQRTDRDRQRFRSMIAATIDEISEGRRSHENY